MTILVTGANGQLGRSLRRLASDSSDRYLFADVAGEDLLRLDITDAGAVESFVREQRVEAIVNCAAYTNVDRAEEEPHAAESLNAGAVATLAEAMRTVGGVLVHVSTDYVFDGRGCIPYREDAAPGPQSVYGRTKLAGEEAVRASGCRHVILRTAWLYSEEGNNFVKTMLRLTAERPRLQVVFDQIGTPTYAGDLAAAIYDIIQRRAYEGREGTYHYSNEGVCSWYDFARAIAELSGRTSCRIDPCHSGEYPTKAVRPSYSVLDKSRFKEAFGLEIPYWRESLARCLVGLSEA